MTHEPGEQFTGSAVIVAGGIDAVPVEVAVEVDLRGFFEPIDGRFHWHGRLAAQPRLAVSSGASVTVRTPHGSAVGRLSDVDPWGRFRITGLGRPPF